MPREDDLAGSGQVLTNSYEIILYGTAVSKKNSYRPHAGGMHKDKQLQAELDNLEMQVPGPCRDLRLEHPEIDFYIKTRSARRDRDNIVTTLLDVLVRCGVLVDDNVSHSNGRMTIHPAEVCEEDSVRIVITPK
jgi:Holliday junction resolvase RusA-like endonuclease